MLSPKTHIAFVSTMTANIWGGSEELWSQTALHLAAQGFRITASVHEGVPVHDRVRDLKKRGIEVVVRPSRSPMWGRILRKAIFGRDARLAAQWRYWLGTKLPTLVVISTGGALPPIELIELCAASGIPFVTISHANYEGWWPEDGVAERYRKALPVALRCYFVSHANCRLVMKQIGCELRNTEQIWNPFNVACSATLPFPLFSEEQGLLLACVGRLNPRSKGQDILFEALAKPTWKARKWRLRLYGEGKMREGLEIMARSYGLSNRVAFAGYVEVDEIWKSNQVLVLPSRYEGLPIVVVEAMLCGRAVVATDVAGNSEVIDDGVTGFLAGAPTVPCLLEALERLWTKRLEMEEIGKRAAIRIRQLVPVDPIKTFSTKLQQLVEHDRRL